MDSFRELADRVLGISDADITEVFITKQKYIVNRYANSFITQSTSVDDITIGLRVRYGNKVGVAYTDNTDEDALKQLFLKAKETAMHSKEDHELSEPPQDIDYEPESFSYDEELGEPDPSRAERILSRVISSSGKFLAFGNMFQGRMEEFFMNSKGFKIYNRRTFASINVNFMDETYKRSGWYQFASYRIGELEEHLDSIVERAYRKAELNKDPVELKPGRYTVIVEPIAFEEVMNFLAWFGFAGKPYIEGRSFLSGKLDSKVFSDKLTIYDNPEELSLFAMHVDYEGVLKRKLPLVEKGVFRNVALNKHLAKRLGRESTGHAVYPFSKEAYPMHIEVAPGDRTLEEMISEVDHGILVSRFWYVNMVEMKEFTLTGMTRDGTFLIENGRITRAVKNMRFTQSFLEALNNVSAISSERQLVAPSNFYSFYPLGSLLPAVRLENFNFSSVSEF